MVITGDAINGLRVLARDFQRWNLDPLDPYARWLSTRTTDGRTLPPYVPVVGPQYSSLRLLIYGMAQNVERNGEHLKLYQRDPSASVWRLYGTSCAGGTKISHPVAKCVPIEPYSGGVLPALAGIYIYATSRELLDLDVVHSRVAVSNYYKFSLRTDYLKRERDINPDNLGDFAAPNSYWQVNDKLVARELELLSPKTIFTFRGRHQVHLRQRDATFVQINDPAWILRGAGGVLKPGRSWDKKASSVTDPTALRLVKSYADKLTGRYQYRRDEVIVYLLQYYRKWTGS